MKAFLFVVPCVLTATIPEFVRREGTRFKVANEDHFVFSANYWQAMNLGAVDSAFGNRTRLIEDLDAFKMLGINNLRIMAASEGPDNSPYRITPTLMKAPGQYDHALLDGLDFAIAEMGQRGIRAVMTLNNQWTWSGGYAQYVSWVTNNSTIPYAPHWSQEAGDFVGGDFNAFLNYALRFYNDPEISAKTGLLFKNHINTIITRRNAYTGLMYKDDPTIFAWELTNEPQSPPRSWLEDISGYIRSLDPNHLVTIGMESKNDEYEFINTHSVSTIDYATVHIWAQNMGVYSMLDSSEANIRKTIDWGLSLVNKVDSWSLKVGKPLVLEEFGLARDNFVALSKDTWFSPSNPTKNRDRYFSALLQQVATSHASSGTYSGFGFWAYAGAARPGDRFISDPPVEPAGWYAVYNTDTTTLQVMKEATATAKNTSQS